MIKNKSFHLYCFVQLLLGLQHESMLYPEEERYTREELEEIFREYKFLK